MFSDHKNSLPTLFSTHSIIYTQNHSHARLLSFVWVTGIFVLNFLSPFFSPSTSLLFPMESRWGRKIWQSTCQSSSFSGNEVKRVVLRKNQIDFIDETQYSAVTRNIGFNATISVILYSTSDPFPEFLIRLDNWLPICVQFSSAV